MWNLYFYTPTLDLKIFLLINHYLKNPFFDWLMPIISNNLVWGSIILSYLFYLLLTRQKNKIFYILIACLLIGLCDWSANLPKKKLARIRPLNALKGCHFFEDNHWQTRSANFIPTKKRGTSFPSAHAANSWLAYLLLSFRFKKLKKILWPIPLAVGYSRIYLGKHYPLDILGGYIWGTLFFVLFLVLYHFGEQKYGQTNWFKRIFKS
ncbi:phosphatase PAP2 family protein [Desulfonauticus submarinus]